MEKIIAFAIFGVGNKSCVLLNRDIYSEDGQVFVTKIYKATQ